MVRSLLSADHKVQVRTDDQGRRRVDLSGRRAPGLVYTNWSGHGYDSQGLFREVNRLKGDTRRGNTGGGGGGGGRRREVGGRDEEGGGGERRETDKTRDRRGRGGERERERERERQKD